MIGIQKMSHFDRIPRCERRRSRRNAEIKKEDRETTVMQGNEAIKSKNDSNWVGQSTGRFAKTERQLNWAKERTSKTAFGLRTHFQISF